jgi:hypothetical protein
MFTCSCIQQINFIKEKIKLEEAEKLCINVIINFCKMWGILQLAEDLLASQKRFCSMEYYTVQICGNLLGSSAGPSAVWNARSVRYVIVGHGQKSRHL